MSKPLVVFLAAVAAVTARVAVPSSTALIRCIFTSIGKAAHGVYFPIVAGMEGMWVVDLDERLGREDLDAAVVV